MKKRMMQVQKAVISMMLLCLPGYGFAATPTGMEAQEEVEMAVPALSGKSLQFAVRTGVGYFTGKMNEDVYDPEPGTPIYHLSHLGWDIDSLVMGKIGASIQYKQWLTIIADSWWKLSDGNGSVDDYDWMFTAEDWSHWSQGDADVISASIVDISANITFLHRNNYILQGILGFKRDRLEMRDHGGKFIYSEFGFRDSVGFFPDIPGLGYDQTMTSPYIGIGFLAFFSNNISLSGRAIFSPFVKGEATDHHYLRNLVTEDEISDGKMFAVDLSVGWAFWHNFIWDISAGYQKYQDTTGDSTYMFNDIGITTEYEDGTGMGQELVRLSTGLTYSF